MIAINKKNVKVNMFFYCCQSNNSICQNINKLVYLLKWFYTYRFFFDEKNKKFFLFLFSIEKYFNEIRINKTQKIIWKCKVRRLQSELSRNFEETLKTTKSLEGELSIYRSLLDGEGGLRETIEMSNFKN